MAENNREFRTAGRDTPNYFPAFTHIDGVKEQRHGGAWVCWWLCFDDGTRERIPGDSDAWAFTIDHWVYDEFELRPDPAWRVAIMPVVPGTRFFDGSRKSYGWTLRVGAPKESALEMLRAFAAKMAEADARPDHVVGK